MTIEIVKQMSVKVRLFYDPEEIKQSMFILSKLKTLP